MCRSTLKIKKFWCKLVARLEKLPMLHMNYYLRNGLAFFAQRAINARQNRSQIFLLFLPEPPGWILFEFLLVFSIPKIWQLDKEHQLNQGLQIQQILLLLPTKEKKLNYIKFLKLWPRL